MSFHLSIFFVFSWLKDGSNRSNKICLAPLPIRIGSANAGSQVLCEWLATAIQIPQKCNYTSWNSTWDIQYVRLQTWLFWCYFVHMYVSFSWCKQAAEAPRDVEIWRSQEALRYDPMMRPYPKRFHRKVVDYEINLACRLELEMEYPAVGHLYRGPI